MGTPEHIGPYRVDGLLGAGGLAEVYRAYDEAKGRWLAIKRVPGDVEDPRHRQRLRREARLVSRLDHPAIVRVHHLLETPEDDYLVMELVAGEPLSSLLADGPLALAEAVSLAMDVAAGLVAAHAEGVIHRDLKASNIIVTPAGGAKILDFGLAKSEESEEEDEVTLAGELVGSFHTMSPEHVYGEEIGPRSDLFSFGTLLYQMVTGERPFTGRGPMEILSNVCTTRHVPPRELDRRIPPELEVLIDELLEKHPENRPPSAERVRRRLERLRDALPSSGDP